ncbi:MAG: leucine-rich repeat domain-containing protein [Treponema sp.]|nr:leucine-rich repeat domain-containing protein [Treponema sp.]
MKLTGLRRAAIVLAVLASGAVLFSCGGKGKKQDRKEAKAAAESAEGEEAEEVVEVNIVDTKDPNAATDFIYETTVDGTGVVIQRYIGSRGNVVIPEEIEGLKVKTIGKDAFNDIKNIASVVLPSSVTSIEASAFYGCYASEISLSSSLKTIAGRAFQNSKVKEITIPSGFEKFVGTHQFAGSALSKVTLPNGITSIPEGCFYNTRLSTVEIPEGVTSIGAEAFSSCNISSFNIPSSLKSTGNKAFAYNPLKDVSIASRDAAVAYGWNSFADCNSSGTMSIALRKKINASGYKNVYYTGGMNYQGDISCCKEAAAR